MSDEPVIQKGKSGLSEVFGKTAGDRRQMLADVNVMIAQITEPDPMSNKKWPKDMTTGEPFKTVYKRGDGIIVTSHDKEISDDVRKELRATGGKLYAEGGRVTAAGAQKYPPDTGPKVNAFGPTPGKHSLN